MDQRNHLVQHAAAGTAASTDNAEGRCFSGRVGDGHLRIDFRQVLNLLVQDVTQFVVMHAELLSAEVGVRAATAEVDRLVMVGIHVGLRCRAVDVEVVAGGRKPPQFGFQLPHDAVHNS